MSELPSNFVPMSDEMRAFLHEIKADPDNDVPRLIFADWLEEQGDPRGPLMRLQCETVPPSIKIARFGELLEQMRPWLNPKPKGVNHLLFHRGLLHVIVELMSTTVHKPLDVLGQHVWWPWVEHVKILDFSRADDEGIHLLSNASCLGEISSLTLVKPYAHSLQDVPSSRHYANLRSFELDCRGADDKAAQSLAQSPHWANLTTLILANCSIGTNGARAIASSPHLSKLSTLDLSFNNVGDAGARALVSSSRLKNLTQLDLSGNNISETTVQALQDRFGNQCELRF